MRVIHYLLIVFVCAVFVNGALLAMFYSTRSGPFNNGANGRGNAAVVRVLRGSMTSRLQQPRGESRDPERRPDLPNSRTLVVPMRGDSATRLDTGSASVQGGDPNGGTNKNSNSINVDAEASTLSSSSSSSSSADSDGAAAVVHGPEHRRQARLVLAIPTVPRANGRADYLLKALDSLEPQLLTNEARAASQDSQITTVLVMTSQLPHPSFEAARAKYSKGRFSDTFVFAVNPRKYKDPDPTRPEPRPNPRDQPGPKVRQQTLDVCGLLDFAEPLGQAVQIMEDDVELCGRGVEAIMYALDKTDRYTPAGTSWSVLRMSYGMNGITLPRGDLAAFRDFSLKNLFLVPIDLLIIEFMCGKHGSADYIGGRPHFVYRYNIYKHLGDVSSFEGRGRRSTPGCFMDYTGGLWPVERMQPGCLRDDLSPCANKPAGQIIMQSFR